MFDLAKFRKKRFIKHICNFVIASKTLRFGKTTYVSRCECGKTKIVKTI